MRDEAVYILNYFMDSYFIVNRHHCPILIAQWQDAVTRKDMAQEFSFSEFKKVDLYYEICMKGL